MDPVLTPFTTSAQASAAATRAMVQARALVGADGILTSEQEPAFDAHMAEFKGYDDMAATLLTREGKVTRMSDRLGQYHQEATGAPLRFNETKLMPGQAKSLGAQFVESDAYKELVASGRLASDGSKFDTGRVVLGSRGFDRLGMGAAATDVIHSGSAGPGEALVTPFYLPGILGLPQRPLVVRDLFSQAQMTQGDAISYAAQTGFDNGAAAVSQATAVNGSGVSGGVKPQSSLGWTRRTAVAEWIATWMVATRQMLLDPGQMAGLIDNQGRLMIQLEEEVQFLSGNGTSPNLSGILDQAIQTLDLTGEDNLDGIRTARRLVRTGLSRLTADAIVLNPVDSEEFDLLKDGFGQYRGGNPIGGPVGIGDLPIWRLTRVESEAIAEGTALVGAFKAGATVYDREPLSVLTTDSHADFFIRNLIVVLFEERVAFPVFFPSAFVEVTLGDFVSGS